MAGRSDADRARIAERGDIHVLYRPRVRGAGEDQPPPEELDDVERFQIVLEPNGRRAIGRDGDGATGRKVPIRLYIVECIQRDW